VKIGVLFVGLVGATASTFVASLVAAESLGVELNGCVTDLPEFRGLKLVKAQELVFGGWDVFNWTLGEVVGKYRILPQSVIEALPKEISSLQPLPGYVSEFDPQLLGRPDHVMSERELGPAAIRLQRQIRRFKKKNQCDCVLAVLLGPPLRGESIGTRELQCATELEHAIQTDRRDLVSSALLYAYSAVAEGCGIMDFTANRTLETIGLVELAHKKGVVLAGRDGSTGQTFLKLGVAQLLQLRGLKVVGWYSTNILGNQDGFVLSQKECRETKIQDKLAGLNELSGLDVHSHVIDISYFLPRGDNKEAWDAVDFVGWWDLGMQLKINWMGRDSILAGPLLLDLIRFLEWEMRSGTAGIAGWLGFYFKCPLGEGISRSPFDQFEELRRHYLALQEMVT
jgi:myo-inositol-1-phosphate synthase